MRVFKTRSVDRFCKSEKITDELLADAIARAERGLIDADLGGGLIKQRVAKPGKGKRGGWRTLIAYRKGQRAVFLFGFAKNDRDNISSDQLASLKAMATGFLNGTNAAIEAELKREVLKELSYAKKE